MLGDFRSRIKFIPKSIQGAVVADGILYITFRNSDGDLYVRCLYFNDGEWNWNDNWLDNDWNSNNPAAVLASK